MIPVFEPVIGQEEIDAVVAALRRGEISGSFGEAIEKFERDFAGYIGCEYGIAVNSGSSALLLAVNAAGIGEGMEVLVSASTNVASALGIYHNGAVPIPVDSESITWNLDLDAVEALITPKTRAILPVHLFGTPVDMVRLCEIAMRHELLVIEDCAESHGATCRGRMTGSFGDMGCFSFYANKIITTGEGGMVVTNDKRFASRLRLLRNLAFTEPRFWHETAGYNFRLTGYQAAMGSAQCKKIEDIIRSKRALAESYSRELSEIPGLQTPIEPEWARNVFWMYPVVVTPQFGMTRNQLMEWLKKDGIDTRTFFCPMNLQPFLQRQRGYREVACPVAERIWETGLYLPSSPHLPEAAILFITDSIRRASGLGKQRT